MTFIFFLRSCGRILFLSPPSSLRRLLRPDLSQCSKMDRLLGATIAMMAAKIVATASTPIALAWNLTDSTRGLQGYGPDGPWPAILVSVGTTRNTSDGSRTTGTNAALYPDFSDQSTILTAAAGGIYDPQNSSSWIFKGLTADTGALGVVGNLSNEGRYGMETIQLIGINDDVFTVPNVSISALSNSSYISPANTSYATTMGTLGFGLGFHGSGSSTNPVAKYLQDNKTIPSNTWSLHMGSISLGQSSSLLLGGYDSSRALGAAGVFDLVGGVIPYVTLRDVTIGVETGGSPFNQSDFGSLNRGPSNNMSTQITSSLNVVRNNSVAMIIDPTRPYIYLPFGTCEAIAAFLPVTWLESLGLYIWNTADPSYARIVNSPAYLSLILDSATIQNFTIKVPFRLLNLTLDKPLTDTPTPYFPCKPDPGIGGAWTFGRAFLQAAFLGVSYDQNKLFLAQAPGPNIGTSNVLPWLPTDITMKTSASTFAETWAQSWKPLPSNSSMSATSANSPSQPSSTLSAGAIAGIVIAIVAAAAITISMLFLLRRRRRRQAVEWKPISPPEMGASEQESQGRVHEVNGLVTPEADGNTFYEVGSDSQRHEMGEQIRYEAGEGPVFELPGTHKASSRAER